MTDAHRFYSLKNLWKSIQSVLSACQYPDKILFTFEHLLRKDNEKEREYIWLFFMGMCDDCILSAYSLWA